MSDAHPVYAQQEADSAAASMAADMAAALAIPRRHRLKLASISTVAVIVLLALVAAVVSFLRPGNVLGGDIVRMAAGAIFVGAYLAFALPTKEPRED